MEQQQQLNIPVHQRYDPNAIVGEDVNPESYNKMPIADFGLNMLMGMGWQEGKGIGRNPQNVLAKPVQYIPNYDRAGLGARKDVTAPSLNKKRRLDQNSKEVDENGKVKNYIEIGVDNKAKPKKVEKNARVIITDGKYEGLKGVVIDVNESKKEVFVELDINEKLVKVDLKSVKLSENERVDFETGKKDGKDGEYVLRGSDRGTNSERGSSKESVKSRSDRDRKEKKKKKKEKREKKRLKWVSPHIMVKVISKKVKDGRLYEKKVFVSDILDECTFSALDEKKNAIDELREKDVQTVMPAINGLVKVLTGEHKDKIAVLLERDKKRNQVLVQFVDTMELEHMTQDDCSTYIEKF